MPDSIRNQLDKARLELLDLSSRNRLVNAPLQAGRAARSIRVRDEIVQEVYRVLVVEGKAMTFAAGVERENEEEEADLPQSDPERHRDSRLQTGLAGKALQKRLLQMYYDARTFSEEQGVNILYLALGFLKWIEADGGKERWAPLVLVPVALERQSASDKFKLKWTQEDPDSNLTLAAKLDAEFGMKLPAPPEWTAEDISLNDYFDAVAQSVSDQKGWRVEPNEVLLGFFSFAKFLMYRDLDPANWPGETLSGHPLVAGLLGQGIPPAPVAIPDDAQLDSYLRPEQIAHVVDADSSQTIAIHEARCGLNLVIQGPPGTGKSQTISNLIASAVMDGKKVLFLAEKMAALDVVKRRLDAIGLGPICLEMHSYKVRKREVLDELARTLNLGKPSVDCAPTGLHQAMHAARATLNGHCERMHRATLPGEVSAYESMGVLTRLRRRGLAPLEVPLDSPRAWSPADRIRRKNLIGQIAGWIRTNGLPNQHPWRGVTCSPLLRADAELLQSKLPALESRLPDLLATAKPYGEFLDEAHRVSGHLAVNPGLADGVDVQTWRVRRGEIRDAIQKGSVLRDLRDKVDRNFHSAAWTQDVKEARHNLASHGDGFLNILFGPFRRAKNLLQSLLKQPIPSRAAERVALLDALIEAQEARAAFRRFDAICSVAFGSLWRGEDSDFALLDLIAQWVAKLDVLDRLSLTAESQTAFQKLEDWRSGFAVVADPLGYANREDLPAVVSRWRANPQGLAAWNSYHALASDAVLLGMGALVGLLADGTVSADQAFDRFASAYHTAILRHRAGEDPELARFDGDTHNRQVSHFEALDRQLLEHNRAMLLATHYAGIPRIAGPVGALGVLTGEIAKKRRHLPLRQMVKQAGPALQALKPVFLMSPLSVAQFLEPGALEFDLLVVDEASQIQPVDALGAISRCRQAVVVGDDKQLPPTQFFARMLGDEGALDEEESTVAGDLESILGLCRAKGFPERMLRWHYRSRHESLIAVSNHEFYEQRLLIVPSPFRAEGGLRFHLDRTHHYEPGAGVNRDQAKAVAEAVIRHAKSSPQLTLGVGAFSVRQRDAILEELESLRRANPDCEGFFVGGGAEPFFVKNLENVQGDERDVIYISVGYGRDASGAFGMRFGALNVPGGERRLNVLISRSKLRCEVFTSIVAEDIDLSRARGLGVAALRTFLQFAESGRLPGVAGDPAKSEQKLVEEIAIALREKGYEVVERFGLAGLFVELAVVDPRDRESMLLGIEVDGTEYHRAKSARDRDRLRPSVLERQGWRLYRVWSADWYQRPEAELAKLVAAVERATAEPRPEPVAAVADTVVVRQEVAEAAMELTPYMEAKIEPPRHLEPHETPLLLMTGLVEEIVTVEGPVHEDEVIARIRQAWGLARAGNRIQQAVRSALGNGVALGRFERVQESFYQKPGTIVKARGGARKLELIALSELDAAVLEALAANFGATREQTPLQAARLLGFKSTSAQLKAALEARVEALLSSKRLVERSGLLVISS